MEVAKISIFSFVAFILTIIAFIFDLIGFSAPYWYYIESGSNSNYGGLWKFCQFSSSRTVCLDHSNVNRDAWFSAVQAMEVLGFVCLLASVVCAVLKVFLMKIKRIINWVTVGMLAAAAVFILIGVIVYGAKAQTSWITHLHFAFAFVIVGAIISIIASVLFIIDNKL